MTTPRVSVSLDSKAMDIIAVRTNGYVLKVTTILTQRILSAEVIVPVSPPLNAPITNNGPVGTPTAQQPTSNVTAIPSTEPPLEVIVPAIVVPVCAALGVAIFLIVFFVKKRKDKQNKGGSRGEGDDSVPMAQLTPTYTDVPAQESGRVYENMPQNDGKAMQTIDPTGIKPAEIEARMHIPYKSLVFLKEIGSGSYGKVFLGYDTS